MGGGEGRENLFWRQRGAEGGEAEVAAAGEEGEAGRVGLCISSRDKRKMLGYDVSVYDALPQPLPNEEGQVTVYVVRVSKESRGLCVLLRFSQLRSLHRMLLEKHKNEPHRSVQLEACGFPSRRPFTMSAFTDKLINERKIQVQKYLTNLFELLYVLEDKDVKKMFRLDEIPSTPLFPEPLPANSNVGPQANPLISPSSSTTPSPSSSTTAATTPSQSTPSQSTPHDLGSNSSPAIVHIPSSSSTSSSSTPTQNTNVFSPFTIEKTRYGIRSWIWTQISVFQYHLLKLTPALKLRFVSLKRQALSISKIKAVHTIYLRGGCSINSLGSGDRPSRLRNSLRAAFPFVLESIGATSLSFHFSPP